MFRPITAPSRRLPVLLRTVRLPRPRSAHSSPAGQHDAWIRTRRILQYGLGGVLAIAFSAVAYYEGAHLYIEHVDMKPESDPEVKKWQWDVVNSEWTGDSAKGGTDPALGYRARHILHAAWSAYTDEAPSASVIIEDPAQSQSIHVVDSRLQQTEHHLWNAILLAEKKLAKSELNPSSFMILLLRHAAVSEQIGVGPFPRLAKEDYERAWQYSSDPTYRQFIAWRLGDLDHRMGHDTDALFWWDRSSRLAQEVNQKGGAPPTGIFRIPQTPLAQRILSSVLVSRSAYLAASGKLKDAQTLEESALELLRSIPFPESIASASPPQALHALYLLQRSSLLSIHLAEVLHAQRRPVRFSMQWLASAAESSERVARILTNSSHADTQKESTGPKNNKLLPVYTGSYSMNNSASALLRDARRTAAEAWNMMGILHEDHEGLKSRLAFECYQRAVNWAGTVKESGKDLQAADDVLDSDWKIYWANYQRLKNVQERPNPKMSK
ncbi:hypothetical protein CPB84DRAFT_1842212 [Gymnopilus junonius]|uniref:Uncharacterized protein n=1 Tax=Gymnopilus junonius TaxID=109634 RepID=A0A9P5TS92_GYMJU|nr:hypothetical protein CPB84DRAFT_1842212 [Gymnopilus junonius]